MRRTTTILAILMLGAAVAPSPVLAEDDWSVTLKHFKRDISPDNPLSQRLRAVRAVGIFGTSDAAKVLLKVVADTEKTEKPLLEEKADVEKQIKRILGPQQFEEKRTLNAKVMPGLRRLQARLDALQRKVVAEATLRQEVAGLFAGFDDADAIKWLIRSGLRDRSWRVRETVARGLGEMRAEPAVDPLIKLLGDREMPVREAALNALGLIGARHALPDIVGALKDPAWQIRAAAVRALGEMGVREAVGPLIDTLETAEGRLQKDIADVLEKLTGQSFGVVAEAWRKWWAANRGADADPFGGGGGGPRGDGGVSYYGITTYSNRIVYVLDVSGSMSRAHEAPDREAAEGETVKVEAAKKELIRSLRSIPSKGAFTIIVYNDLIKVWKPKLIPAVEGNKNEAVAFVKGLNAASSTNIYGAMEAVFNLAGMGARDKHYDMGADTVFLLTDGSPTKPDGSMDSTEKILVACREWNRLKRVTIHCIGIGRAHNGGFLRTLATEHGGKYVAR